MAACARSVTVAAGAVRIYWRPEDPLNRHPQLRLIQRWLPLLIASVATCAIVAGVVTSQLTPSYVSTVRLLSGPDLSGGAIDNSAIVAGQNLAPTYAQLATTRALLLRAIATTKVAMSVDDLQAAVTTHVPVSSGLLTVSVAASNPKVASDLANAIAGQLVDYPPSLSHPKPTSNVNLSVIDPAVPPDRPEGPRPLFGVALGAAIGLVLAMSAAFLVENVRRLEPDVISTGPEASRRF